MPGRLPERFEKARLVRLVKLLEVAAMALAAVGFYLHSLGLLLAVLALMGLHSTLFGPIKYAILPQVLAEDELVGGNGLVETGTSLSILIGSVAGNTLIAVPRIGPLLASAAVLGVALAGYFASRGMPPAPATAPGLRFNPNLLSETWRVLRYTLGHRGVCVSVLGISWFWFVGATLTTQLPLYTRVYLGGSESVLTLALTLFSIGVGVGSLLCERASGRHLEPGLVPLGALGLTLAGVDLYLARPHAALHGYLGWLAFLAEPGGWRIAVDLSLMGAAAGFYIVPLFAMLQGRAERSHLSRVIAGTNIVNALFMVLAAAFGLAMLHAGVSVPALFLAVALGNALVSVALFAAQREFVLRALTWLGFRWREPLRGEGLQSLPMHGALLLVGEALDAPDVRRALALMPRPVRPACQQPRGALLGLAGAVDTCGRSASQRIEAALARGEAVLLADADLAAALCATTPCWRVQVSREGGAWQLRVRRLDDPVGQHQ